MRRFRKVTWSQLELDYLSKHRHDPISQLAGYMSKSNNAVKKQLTLLDGKVVPSKKKKVPPGENSIKGKRKDCNNLFLRSRWEANCYRKFARLKSIVLQEYEPRTFSFAEFGILRGTVSYTPDFKLTYKSGREEWIEVKGYIRAADKTKIRRFKKFFPEEFKKLKCIVGSANTAAARFFEEMDVPVKYYYNDLNKKCRDIIPHWE
jgi:hypothetical protein